MSTFIDQLGVLLKADEAELQRIEDERQHRVVEQDRETARAMQRVRDLRSEVPQHFREIAVAFPGDFAYREDGAAAAVPGTLTCELVEISRAPERHLRITLQPDSTFVRVQWLRDGMKEDSVRQVGAEQFDRPFLQKLVTQLVSDPRWARGFYPIV